MNARFKISAALSIILLASATATFAAGPPTQVAGQSPTHLVAFTGNLYWTSYSVNKGDGCSRRFQSRNTDSICFVLKGNIGVGNLLRDGS